MAFRSSRLMKGRSPTAAVRVSPCGICPAARAMAVVVRVPRTLRSRSASVSQVLAITPSLRSQAAPPFGGRQGGGRRSTMNPEVIEMVEAMTRNWGAIALRGFLAVLLGVTAIVWPGPTVAVFVILLGAFALVEGVTNLVCRLLLEKKKQNGGRT